MKNQHNDTSSRTLKQEIKAIESDKARLSKLNTSGFAPNLVGAGMEISNIKVEA